MSLFKYDARQSEKVKWQTRVLQEVFITHIQERTYILKISKVPINTKIKAVYEIKKRV